MPNPTAAIIVIGNEILSGRTQDVNVQYIAKQLSAIGIILLEVRVTPDNVETIADTILSTKSKYDYIFTTGGIGPTHDDVTSEAIAKALNLPIQINVEAHDKISAFVEKSNTLSKSALIKMAYLPQNATLISSEISGAFGFIIENIFVMAGVPSIMQAMFQEVLPLLNRGEDIHTKSLELVIDENVIIDELAAIQKKYPEVEIGSYPFHANGKSNTSIVLRGTNTFSLEQAFEELAKHFVKSIA